MTAMLTLVEERLSLPVETFTIDQTAGKHDMATITLKKLPPFKLQSGTPVRLQQYHKTEEFDFYGYIDTAMPYENGRGNAGGVYFLLSASTALRSGAPQTWKDRAPIQIGTDIVGRHGLALEMDKTEGIVGHFSQATGSDWETIVQLATDLGFVAVADNTTVRLLNPASVIRRAESQVMFPLSITDGTNFITEESLVPVGYESYEFVGTDKFGVTFKVTVNEDSPVARPVREEVTSLGDALAAADRVRRRQASQNRATMTTDYHPSIRSGQAVLVQETDRQRHWFVLSAVHTFSELSTSVTSLSLCRFDDRAAPGAVPNYSRSPASVLTSGRWRAATSWVREL